MPKRVLVVDDDPEARDFMRACLADQGFEVVEAATEGEAFDRLAERVPCLICLDLMLPDSSGLDVCERLARVPGLRDVPVLVISARRLPQDRAMAAAMGATGYLTKPLTPQGLVAQVHAVLAARRSEEVPLSLTLAR
ncbi:MAG: response regulator [Myxococcales bacterium]